MLRTAIDATTLFESQRRFLKGLAYRMLGSVAEAEDIVHAFPVKTLPWRAAAEIDNALASI